MRTSVEARLVVSPPVDERWEQVIAAVLRALRRIVAAVEPRSTLPPAPASALRERVRELLEAEG